ncbi:MAG: HD domain-containing protein [Segniliparus sp.]|uniref:HD domain-containing protein n=1 Tax=Segniliparus sp. TaxID=2804064 RepID=UPI003F3D10EC
MTDSTFTSPGWLSDPSFGKLGLREQLREARRILADQLLGAPHAVKAILQDRRPATALSRLAPAPDTDLCKNAELVAVSTYSSAVLGHVYRCWSWATLIAEHEGLPYDPEALYCAALLHDVGLTSAHAPDSGCGCFAVSGARTSASLLAAWGAPGRTVELVAKAIALHMDARPAKGAASEIALLHDAAFLDVVGSGVRRTTQADRATVLAAHPRTGFASEFTQALRKEATSRPRSRAALSYRLGAPLAVRLNPLEHHPLARSAPHGLP